MNAAAEGRRKPFSERSKTSSKDRTTKSGRKSPRKKHDRTLPSGVPVRAIIGDQTCEEARFHTVADTGYHDLSGHSITKQRYKALFGIDAFEAEES